jgi:energy-coupling factor transporter transmembrane protein EcfT
LLGGVEEKEGAIGRKKILEVLQVPFKEAKKAINEAAVPEADYQRYIEGVAKKSKEITDAGALRAGKTNSQSRRLTAAARVIQKLSPWLNSLLIKSLTRGEYSGSPEEMLEAKLLLEKVSKQFADCASAIH